ncbi:hypothetical protein Tco_0819760 [Tanacetum coccineum]|uniref:Uncharacterized protein n=1 Tax=Tanacetum coccineum TaxID=301880 RepID=A0ABQ5ABU4_9ASTR
MAEKCLLKQRFQARAFLKKHMVHQRVLYEGRTMDIVERDKDIEEKYTYKIEGTEEQNEGTEEQNEGTEEHNEGTEEHNEGTEEHNEGTEEHIEGTEEHIEGTEEQIESTDGQRKGTEDHTEEGSATQATQTPTSTIFGDDETIAKVLLNMSQAKAVSREKEKGVELKDIEETDRPRPTSTRSLLTLKPLPKIDPKDKGKKKIEEEDESESESDGIPEAEKKFKQLESDEEMARKIQEEWEGEEERNRIAEEKAANEALIRNFDDIKARIEADRLLAEKLQEQEREQFTIEERAKFLHDIIAAQRRFLAQQRSEATRNRPPTKNQLRNQMMTNLKHVGNFKHAELKIKKFWEVQALYEILRGVDSSKSESTSRRKVKEEVKRRRVKKKRSTRKRKLVLGKKDEVRKRRYSSKTPSEDEFQDEIPEGFDRVLWGDLMIMFNPDDENEFWNSQQDWNIVSWKLHGSSGVHTLVTETGLVIHMLVEKKYPLRKEVLMQMLKLKLESEEDSTMALELIRFIKKILAELEPEE